MELLQGGPLIGDTWHCDRNEILIWQSTEQEQIEKGLLPYWGANHRRSKEFFGSGGGASRRGLLLEAVARCPSRCQVSVASSLATVNGS